MRWAMLGLLGAVAVYGATREAQTESATPPPADQRSAPRDYVSGVIGGPHDFSMRGDGRARRAALATRPTGSRRGWPSAKRPPTGFPQTTPRWRCFACRVSGRSFSPIATLRDRPAWFVWDAMTARWRRPRWAPRTRCWPGCGPVSTCPTGLSGATIRSACPIRVEIARIARSVWFQTACACPRVASSASRATTRTTPAEKPPCW
jgi:hypothetical protein